MKCGISGRALVLGSIPPYFSVKMSTCFSHVLAFRVGRIGCIFGERVHWGRSGDGSVLCTASAVPRWRSLGPRVCSDHGPNHGERGERTVPSNKIRQDVRHHTCLLTGLHSMSSSSDAVYKLGFPAQCFLANFEKLNKNM